MAYRTVTAICGEEALAAQRLRKENWRNGVCHVSANSWRNNAISSQLMASNIV